MKRVFRIDYIQAADAHVVYDATGNENATVMQFGQGVAGATQCGEDSQFGENTSQ